MSNVKLSVIVPAYNEEARLGPTLKAIHQYLGRQEYGWEVLVVDDGSTDGTAAVATKMNHLNPNIKLIRLEQNQGKGAAVREGMLAAEGQFRLFSDADLSTPIEETARFIEHAKTYPVVIGSRRVKGHNLVKRQPLLRELSGRLFSLLVRLIVLPGFLDTQCGFKMFTKDAAMKIFVKQKIERFGFDVEILFIAQEILGYKILEAPVTWVDSRPTKVHLFRDATRMFRDLFQIRANHQARLY